MLLSSKKDLANVPFKVSILKTSLTVGELQNIKNTFLDFINQHQKVIFLTKEFLATFFYLNFCLTTLLYIKVIKTIKEF